MSKDPNQPDQDDDLQTQKLAVAPEVPTVPDRPAQDLLEEMRALAAKVEKEEEKREKHVQGQVKDNDDLALARKPLHDALETAEQNMAYFEQAKQSGLLQGDDLQQYEDLKTRVEELTKTVAETHAKAGLILAQPEVGGRIMDAAQLENERFDVKAEKKNFLEGLTPEFTDIFKMAEDHIKESASYQKDRAVTLDEAGTAIEELGKILPNSATVKKLFEELRRNRNADVFRKGLFEHAESIKGLFKGGQRKAVNALIESPELGAVNLKLREYEELNAKGQEFAEKRNSTIDGINARLTEKVYKRRDEITARQVATASASERMEGWAVSQKLMAEIVAKLKEAWAEYVTKSAEGKDGAGSVRGLLTSTGNDMFKDPNLFFRNEEW